MFVLDRAAFRAVDTSRLLAFVTCWEKYYTEGDGGYFANLNIGHELSQENITGLLRWKDPRMLTHPKKEDGQPNPRVTRVLARVNALNEFRRGDLTPEAFREITHAIFPNGFVWQLFLFHIARPVDWPIADQNVFRAFSVLFNVEVPQCIAAFEAYRFAFQEMATGLRNSTGIDENSHDQVVRTNKRLDNALFAFGQFLATYDRE